MARRLDFLPPVAGYDQTDDEAALGDFYAGAGLPTASVDDIGPVDAVTPNVGGSMLMQRPGAPVPPPAANMKPPPAPSVGYSDFADADADKKIGDASERDRMNRLLRGIELGVKQLTAGVLRQPMAEVVGENTDYEGRTRAQLEKDQGQRYSRFVNDRNFAATEEQRKLAQAHQAWEQQHKLEREGVGDKAGADARAEAARHNLANEDIGRKRNEAMIKAAQAAAGKAGDEEKNASFVLDGTLLEAPKGIGKEEVKELKNKAELYNGALEAFDSIKEAIEEYVAHPSPESFNNINSRSRVAASAMTSAIGGGAMAEAEAKAAISAMGADPTGFLAGKALFDAHVLGEDPKRSAAPMLSKLGAVRDTLRRSGLKRFTTHNYRAAQSPDDQRALEWANSHRDDPRAAEILKLHGGP